MKTKFQCRLTSALPTLSTAAGTKTRTLKLSLIAATLLALGAIASPARADNQFVDRGGWRHDSHGPDRGGWRQDSREIRQDRAELHHDLRAVRHDFRPNHTQGHQPHSTSWQAPRPQQANPVVNAQPNNDRHLGWQQGRGNPHRS